MCRRIGEPSDVPLRKARTCFLPSKSRQNPCYAWLRTRGISVKIAEVMLLFWSGAFVLGDGTRLDCSDCYSSCLCDGREYGFFEFRRF